MSNRTPRTNFPDVPHVCYPYDYDAHPTTVLVDGVPCSPVELQVFTAAFVADARLESTITATSNALERVRGFRDCVRRGLIVLGAFVALATIGCSDVHAPSDAVSDAPVTRRNGCLDLRNTIETYGPDCDTTGWTCPWSEPVDEPTIQACNLAVYAARESCDGMHAALETCR